MLRRTLLLTAFIFAATAGHAVAQTEPQTILTWRATTYVPGFYGGKTLPVPGSKIVVGLDLLQSGRPANLSGKTIYWYLGDKFIAGGVGLTRLALTVPDTLVSTIQVRAALPEDGIAKTLTIPVSEPRAVIQPPSPDRRVHSSTFSLTAWPYFFNVSSAGQLTFDWKLAGQDASSSGDPDKLDVTVTAGTRKGSAFPITLRIANPGKSFEFARGELTFTFDP